jgi:hypothetical protein
LQIKRDKKQNRYFNSTLTLFPKVEKSIRFTLNPKGNRIDFSDFSPWDWGKKLEKSVLHLISQSRIKNWNLTKIPLHLCLP